MFGIITVVMIFSIPIIAILDKPFRKTVKDQTHDAAS
jgi:hypothetical protein